MKKHHALARRLRDRQDDYLRFTTDFGRRLITTDLNATPHGQAATKLPVMDTTTTNSGS